jgi:hypothetical protein
MSTPDPLLSPTGADKKRPPRGSRRADIVLAVVSVVVVLVLIEIGFRVATGKPAFRLVDWRLDQVQMDRLGEHGMMDPELGWSVRAGFESESYNTLDLGIRRNFDETTVRKGHILAVGDSFTEGWEVDDAESWPAHLEKRTGIPVLNAGVSAYGTDQIVLRAERFLPLVNPTTLIVGFLEFDIVRSGFSHFGAPKPYFTIERGELRYHPPAPFEAKTHGGAFASTVRVLRRPLGYSAVADHLMSRLAPNYWYGADGVQFHRVSTDVVAVTCALLARLKKKTDAAGVRTLLFMQYYAVVILENERPTENARRVMDCARAAGIEVVDQFAPLRAIAAADPDAIWNYYLTKGEIFTHMTSFGNEHAAELLAKALGK